jgi:hypothetical protein
MQGHDMVLPDGLSRRVHRIAESARLALVATVSIEVHRRRIQ